MPLAITEIGSTVASESPGMLLRSYCQLALAGAESYIWYPLNPRGDGLVPLITWAGDVTGAGRAYRLVSRWFEGRTVTDVSPDPFTYGCQFGNDAVVLWGAPRSVEVTRPGIRVLDATGDGLPRQGLSLSETDPIVLIDPEGKGLEAGVSYVFGPQTLIADSYHQFALDGPKSWQHWVRMSDGTEAPMEIRPGQQNAGVPWDPYLGTRLDGVARADAEWVIPSLPPAGPVEVLLRYKIEEDVHARLEIEAAPAKGAQNGLSLRVLINDRIILDTVVAKTETLTLGAFRFSQDDTIEIAVGPHGTPRDNTLNLRARLRRIAN